MNRVFLLLLSAFASGCLHRWVEPPPATDEGAFLVHVVRTPDESLQKILTWYTGTTLSQDLVMRSNPFLMQRPLKVGDRLVIPFETVANENGYGMSPVQPQSQAPNLLMEGPTAKTKSVPQSEPVSELPTMPLETFNDETNPDSMHPEVARQESQNDERKKQLEREIAEKQRELDALQTPSASDSGDHDMPPPGLLQEFEGS